ncbi:MAG: PAS domain S-box-containing protein [Candidatus Azotimanducaceae bacterium]|jgi:PAS domain S-box-containing protein
MPDPFDSIGFKATARKLPDAIVTTDEKGKITWANPAFTRLCGFHMNEIKGKRPGSFLQGEQTDPETVKAMHLAFNEQSDFSAEILNHHKKGHSYWAEISVTPFFDHDGKLEGHISIARNTSSRHAELSQREEPIVSIYTALLAKEAPVPESDYEADPFLSQLELT